MAVYSDVGPASFAELIEPLPQGIRDVARHLREIITATIPDADEAVSGGAKMGMALYSIGGPTRVVCGIQPTETMCKLFFHRWERLAEAGYRLEGSGKNARHIKIRSVRDLEPEALVAMITIARGGS